MKTLTSIALSCLLSVALPALADERPDHYAGEPSETLEQALSNFSEYNDKLDKILSKDELSATDLNEVHQLTYTLENALEKIRSEYADLAEVLEEVHIASETTDSDSVKSKGQDYLETANKVSP